MDVDAQDKIIDGRAFAARLRARLANLAADLKAGSGLTPGLAVVLVGDDAASDVYVRSKGRLCRGAGLHSEEHRLGAGTSEADLLALVARLNGDPAIHGILVQMPLPPQIDAARVINAISPEKDVDGFHVENIGRLATGQPALVPCTPLGCLMLLRDRLGSLAGLEAVVIGRSNIVGKPMAQLLLREDCTVTIAHSRSRDLPAIAARADILVAAVGRPGMIGADWVKPGATVIDVGINRVTGPDGKGVLLGDVDFDAVLPVAGAITPVPGGVGPMTIACLLANTLTAACRAERPARAWRAHALTGAAEALGRIRALGDPERAAEMAARSRSVRAHAGVAMPALDALVSEWRAGSDVAGRVALARGLWDSDLLEARIAAARLLAQARIPEDEPLVWEEFLRWLPEFDAVVIADQACRVAERRLAAVPSRLDVAEGWLDDPNPLVRRAAMLGAFSWSKASYPDEAGLGARVRILGWASRLASDPDARVRQATAAWLRSLSVRAPELVRAFLDSDAAARFNDAERREAAARLR